jgi:hypothetical protein
MTRCPTWADTLSGGLCWLIKRPHIMQMSSPDSHTPDAPPVLVLVRDLIFASRITATAQAMGVGTFVVRDPAKLKDAYPHATRQTLIADLNQPGALHAANEWRSHSAGRVVIGFVAHVDAEIIREARELGIDQVLPRSRFVVDLESLLRSA